jgi:unsaturated rhamnogalacturonyl hydrolase
MINTGKLLFGLWRETGDDRYRKAAARLRDQLRVHPRTLDGGFWHKLIYPHQMWLDGIYMEGPFYAEYAATFDEPEGLDDVAHQIILIEQHTRDPKTGLLYHGWDESRRQQWANPETGASRNFWGRAIGWFMMALPDALDHFPADHPQRETLSDFRETRGLGGQTGVRPWYRCSSGRREGNYWKTPRVYVIAIARGRWATAPRYCTSPRAFHNTVVTVARPVVCNQICYVTGWGRSYRDGSFENYISERVVTNDDKGVGPFILASAELEMA